MVHVRLPADKRNNRVHTVPRAGRRITLSLARCARISHFHGGPRTGSQAGVVRSRHPSPASEDVATLLTTPPTQHTKQSVRVASYDIRLMAPDLPQIGPPLRQFQYSTAHTELDSSRQCPCIAARLREPVRDALSEGFSALVHCGGVAELHLLAWAAAGNYSTVLVQKGYI